MEERLWLGAICVVGLIWLVGDDRQLAVGGVYAGQVSFASQEGTGAASAHAG